VIQLSNLVEARQLEKLLNSGELVRRRSSDGRTEMLSLMKLPSTEFSASCRGLVIRDESILARPIRKFWPQGTSGFPETRLENLRPADAILTRFIDGYPATLYEGLSGYKFLAGANQFFGPLYVWASQYYRKRYGRAQWPEAYTPNFVLVHPTYTKRIPYKEPEIYLIGLVHLGTGTELPWQDVKALGKHNGIPVVEEVKGNLFDMPHMALSDKGVVARWDLGADPPLRVAVISEDYEKRDVIEGLTPVEIVEMLKSDLPLEPFKDSKYPEDFRRWIDNWENALYGMFRNFEQRLAEIFNAAELAGSPPFSEDEMAAAMGFFRGICGEDDWVLEPLRKMLMDEDYTPELWDRVKTKVEKARGWTPR